MELLDWRTIKELSLTEAAYLLGGVDPGPLRQGRRMIEGEPSQWTHKLERAVKAKSLVAHRIVVRSFAGLTETKEIEPSSVGAHEVLVPGLTRVSVLNLVTWCLANQAPVPWPFLDSVVPNQEQSTSAYPPELSAAIEAFEAVRSDPSATIRKSPKAAIVAWLKQNKPELTQGARDRIAIVANWQPAGGAPKMP